MSSLPSPTRAEKWHSGEILRQEECWNDIDDDYCRRRPGTVRQLGNKAMFGVGERGLSW
jgi:hypothetical protein